MAPEGEAKYSVQRARRADPVGRLNKIKLDLHTLSLFFCTFLFYFVLVFFSRSNGGRLASQLLCSCATSKEVDSIKIVQVSDDMPL